MYKKKSAKCTHFILGSFLLFERDKSRKKWSIINFLLHGWLRGWFLSYWDDWIAQRVSWGSHLWIGLYILNRRVRASLVCKELLQRNVNRAMFHIQILWICFYPGYNLSKRTAVYGKNSEPVERQKLFGENQLIFIYSSKFPDTVSREGQVNTHTIWTSTHTVTEFLPKCNANNLFSKVDLPLRERSWSKQPMGASGQVEILPTVNSEIGILSESCLLRVRLEYTSSPSTWTIL